MPGDKDSPLFLFVLTFLSIYAAMHALVFWGIFPLLAGHRALPALTGLWMTAMIVAPVLVRVLDRLGHLAPARALAWVGYCWMGFLFLAFSLFSLLGLWHLLTTLSGFLLPAARALTLHGPVSAAVVLLIVLAAGLYGFYEASRLRVERVRLESTKLPAGIDRLRIAQVSDLHLGLIHREEVLAPIVSLLQELNPDLVVATGDVVDAQVDHLNGMTELWRRLEPPLGKFAVTGNHEYYAGLAQGLDFLDRSGFIVLRNAGIRVQDTLTLVGVDDPAGGGAPDETALLKSQGGGLFTVLLKHRPRLRESAAGLFDLQLSGHAHRGQIFPFNFLTALEYPKQSGLYPLPGGGHLYTSRGTGTWGPPMRILSPPEITLFEIVRF